MTSTTSPLLWRAAAAVAASVAAGTGPATAPAAASPGVLAATYAISFDGAYAYHATELSPGVMDAVRIWNASWKSQTQTAVTITRKATAQTSVVPMPSRETTYDGTYVENLHGLHPIQQSCVTTQDRPAGEGLAGVRTDEAGVVTLDLQPVDHFSGQQACKYAIPDTGGALLGRDLVARLSFPVDRLGEDTITLPAASAAGLPCWSYALTTSCEASWSGTVTLTRLATMQVPGDEPAPAPAPAGGAATPPAPAKPPTKPKPRPRRGAEELDEVVPLVDDFYVVEIPPLWETYDEEVTPLLAPAADMRFGPRAGRLGFRAACEGGCSGTAVLRTAAPAKGGRRASRLGAGGGLAKRVTMHFTTGPGAKLVALRLTARARANLRAARRGTLQLVLRDRASGRATTAARILRAR